MLLKHLVNMLEGIPASWLTVIISASPIAELRGAIPVAIYLKQPALQTYILAIMGNFLPVIPLLYLLDPVSERLRKFKIWRGFFDWLFERTKKKAALVQKYEALGLMLFVAIPLPVTGVWTGCVAASLFKIKRRYAIPAVTAGMIIAGTIITFLTLMGKMAFTLNAN